MNKLCSLGFGFLVLAAPLALRAETITLSTNGVPAKTVAIPTTASAALQTTAAEFAGVLNQITSGTFAVVTFDPAVGPGAASIVLGKSSDLNLGDELPNSQIKEQEHYLIGSGSPGNYIIIAGASDLAVTDAAYDYLQTLGCRWYFPGAKWEIVPAQPSLSWVTAASPIRTKSFTMGTKALTMKIYHDELPDYKSRFIWFPYHNHTGGNFPYREWQSQYDNYVTWSRRNRNVEGIKINFYHNYANIVTWAKEQTPSRWKQEYYALIDGVRGHPTPSVEKNYQLCVSNAEVVQLCKDWASYWIGANPTQVSVSMEPNDGSAWCECQHCEAIQPISSGFVTDRVMLLANAVAEVLPANKFVGILAYGTHAQPPSAGVTVNSKIYVDIATGFLMQGWTFEELLEEWGDRTPNVGVYDYLSNGLYDVNLPLRSDGANLEYMQTSFPQWHLDGADNYNAQSTYGMGPFGLGHYVALKMLWDTSLNVDDIRTDFITKCFGTGAIAETMTDFYDRIDRSNGYRLSPDLIGRLFRCLDTAYGLTSDSAVIARLDDLALWLRFCEMRIAYEKLPLKTPTFAPRQGQAEAILRHTWKMRASNMVDSLAIFRMKPLWDDYYLTPHDDSQDEFDWPLNTVNWTVSGTSFPPGTYELNWAVPMVQQAPAAEGHPWKENGTYTHADSLQFVSNGIVNNPLLIEEPRSFDSDLVFTGTALAGSTNTVRGSLTTYRFRKMAFYLRSDANGVLPALSMSTGWSSNKGPSPWILYSRNGETQLQSGQIAPDEQTYVQTFLPVTPNTDYLLIWDDHQSYSKISWDPGAKVTMIADSERPYCGSSATRRYFYVPKGTKNIVAYAYWIGACTFYNAAGVAKHVQPTASSGIDITIPVSETDDDQIWYVTSLLATDFFFQNIPGVMAARPDELLIPKAGLVDLYPAAGSATATRGSFLKMLGKNALYLRGDATNMLPVLTISNGWANQTYGDAQWTLYTEDGRTALETGTIAPTKVPYTVSFTTVPGDDNFLFVYDDKKGSSSITWPAGKYVSIAANPSYKHTQSGAVTRRYFYVPKGATSVDYQASAMLQGSFYTASGTLKHLQPAATNVVGSIPVGPGEDNQIWYIATGFGATNFYFTNIPGHLATRPDELLIPHWTKFQ